MKTLYRELGIKLSSVEVQPVCNVDPSQATLGIRFAPDCWDKTMRFEWKNGGWHGEIPLGTEFKFVKEHSDGKIEWEQGSNRVVKQDESTAKLSIQL